MLQDELDDILRYGAAELFADAVAATQKAQQAASSKGTSAGSLCSPIQRLWHSHAARLSLQSLHHTYLCLQHG